MIRVLVFLAVLAVVAFGAAWLVDRPGEIVLTWQGYRVETSMLVAILGLVVVMVSLAIIWKIVRAVLGLPAFVGFWSRARRRKKGLNALSRGMIAVGAGDLRAAQRHAADAVKHLAKEPLALLLKAQTAQLSGDRATAETTFAEMVKQPETRLLGLRGLHVEARRRGDAQTAHAHAAEAHRIAGLPWAGQAVLDHRTAASDWAGALAAVERNATDKHLDKATANRQRAVLKTAVAIAKAEQAPDDALRLAREALKLAPDLVPAAALAGRLLVRQGEVRRAARLIESAWRLGPHPDLADVYLHVRHGDSASDRLARAETLAQFAPDDPESRLTIARAALEAREFERARVAMLPLIEGLRGRPTVRACLTMADLEEVSGGGDGKVREWLARAARAPRDPAWIADGVAADAWSPVSPVTGRLDAFVWRRPTEQLAGPSEGMLALSGQAEEIPTASPPLPPIDAHERTVPMLGAAINTPPAEEGTVAANTATSMHEPAASKNLLLLATPPQPVVFPLSAAPDDPGPAPHEESGDKRFGFLA